MKIKMSTRLQRDIIAALEALADRAEQLEKFYHEKTGIGDGTSAEVQEARALIMTARGYVRAPVHK